MKVWYHKEHDMYVPSNPWWGTEDEPDEWDKELVEMEIEKEELIVMMGSDDPHIHAGRWEDIWSEDRFEHSVMTKIPWPYGKYKITIEPIGEDKE